MQRIVYWNSLEGIQRLEATAYRLAFFRLAHLYERQSRPTYCAVASAVMVLNALRLGKAGLALEQKLDVAVPESHGGGTMRYNAYSQARFARELPNDIKGNACLEGKNPDRFDPGLNLISLAKVLRYHLAHVDHRPAEQTEGAEALRRDVCAFVNDGGCYLIANFDGRVLSLPVGGHCAPLAAYHADSDSVLVLDVAGHKSPWFWVAISDLYRAMHTRDGETWRGWLCVRDRL